MNIISAKNPKWANPTKTKIDLLVNFESIPEEFVPCTCHNGNDHPYINELYNRAISGEFGSIQEWDGAVEISHDEAVGILRSLRTSLLEKTDYVENPTYWQRLSEAKQAEWAEYRNALRDITQYADDVSAEYECIVDGDNYTFNPVLKGVVIPVKPE